MGEKNSYLENVLMGNKFGLGEGAAEGSCLSSRWVRLHDTKGNMNWKKYQTKYRLEKHQKRAEPT